MSVAYYNMRHTVDEYICIDNIDYITYIILKITLTIHTHYTHKL